jgi:hypothetical protein
MKRRLLAFPAAGAAMLLLASSAAAWGTVTVETNACDYTIHADLDGPPAVIGWEVRVFADQWQDGAVVASGSGAPDAEGRLTIGPVTAAAGHYNAIVDDETPVSGDVLFIGFTLICATPTATPTATVAPTATATDTAAPTATATSTPTGQELPAQGTPPLTGGELGLTPPPTDTTPAANATSGSLPTALLLALLAIASGGLAMVRRPRVVARPRSGSKRTTPRS